MRILYITGREISYPRNDMMLRAFRCWAEVDVVAPQRRGSLVFDSLGSILSALPHLVVNSYDLVCTGFYGHLITLPIALLSRKPVLFDAFVSTYDTLIEDRKTFAPRSGGAKLAHWLDQVACMLAGQVLLDTRTHTQYFASEFGVNPDKLNVLFVGCDEQLFYPRPSNQGKSPEILYYSSYLPLHGTQVVIQAAKQLEGLAKFRLIGTGKEYIQARTLADSIQARNIEFVPSIPLTSLPSEIARATICLGGHFGASPKAARVIAGKTYQCLAMGKATIVGENLANHELLTHEKDAWFCAMNDPEDLARSIETLLNNVSLRDTIGIQARTTFLERASTPVLQAQLKQIVIKQLSLPFESR
jgi:glycosyltransferase involved in cell wall biosynthesis